MPIIVTKLLTSREKQIQVFMAVDQFYYSILICQVQDKVEKSPLRQNT